MVSCRSFPRGREGLALFWLRGSLAALIVIESQHQHLLAQPSILTLLVSGLAAGLSLGVLTTICGAIAAIGGMSMLLTGHLAISESGVVTMILCLVVAILGPGLYSLDGILFGRRKVVL
jgi:hypothetical protein